MCFKFRFTKVTRLFISLNRQIFEWFCGLHKDAPAYPNNHNGSTGSMYRLLITNDVAQGRWL